MEAIMRKYLGDVCEETVEWFYEVFYDCCTTCPTVERAEKFLKEELAHYDKCGEDLVNYVLLDEWSYVTKIYEERGETNYVWEDEEDELCYLLKDMYVELCD